MQQTIINHKSSHPIKKNKESFNVFEDVTTNILMFTNEVLWHHLTNSPATFLIMAFMNDVPRRGSYIHISSNLNVSNIDIFCKIYSLLYFTGKTATLDLGYNDFISTEVNFLQRKNIIT